MHENQKEPLYKVLTITTKNNFESDTMPKNRAVNDYQNRILVAVKSSFGIGNRHNWQIQLVNCDTGLAEAEHLLESFVLEPPIKNS